jgi:hypothetical protein
MISRELDYAKFLFGLWRRRIIVLLERHFWRVMIAGSGVLGGLVEDRKLTHFGGLKGWMGVCICFGREEHGALFIGRL